MDKDKRNSRFHRAGDRFRFLSIWWWIAHVALIGIVYYLIRIF